MFRAIFIALAKRLFRAAIKYFYRHNILAISRSHNVDIEPPLLYGLKSQPLWQKEKYK
jgi:hypothetical protein